MMIHHVQLQHFAALSSLHLCHVRCHLSEINASLTLHTPYHRLMRPQVLLSMELTLHSMEVVNTLASAAQLPRDAAQLYVTHCISCCQGMRVRGMDHILDTEASNLPCGLHCDRQEYCRHHHHHHLSKHHYRHYPPALCATHPAMYYSD
jgi:CCR4-NOT transcription complex subunit 11